MCEHLASQRSSQCSCTLNPSFNVYLELAIDETHSIFTIESLKSPLYMKQVSVHRLTIAA